MKRILTTLMLGVCGLVVVGCKEQAAVVQNGSPRVAVVASAPAPTFQPYVLVNQPAPRPEVISHKLRYLSVSRLHGEEYLSDPDGHYYHIGRDPRGYIYPAYYDTATDEDYPLYYDSSRDRYYRVCRFDNRYYMNFVGDPSSQYYPCDQDFSYTSYDPPQYDCPVIYDGYHSFTCYDQPAYYSDPNRYYNHWRDNDWISAVPVVIGFYFVLNQNDNSGPAWYYGYHGGNHQDRWAYRHDNRDAPVTYYQGGQRFTRNFAVTPPASVMAPRQQWARLTSVASNHHSPSRVWGGEMAHRPGFTHAGGFNVAQRATQNNHGARIAAAPLTRNGMGNRVGQQPHFGGARIAALPAGHNRILGAGRSVNTIHQTASRMTGARPEIRNNTQQRVAGNFNHAPLVMHSSRQVPAAEIHFGNRQPGIANRGPSIAHQFTPRAVPNHVFRQRGVSSSFARRAPATQFNNRPFQTMRGNQGFVQPRQNRIARPANFGGGNFGGFARNNGGGGNHFNAPQAHANFAHGNPGGGGGARNVGSPHPAGGGGKPAGGRHFGH